MDAFGFFALFIDGYFMHNRIFPFFSGSENWFVGLELTELDCRFIGSLSLVILKRIY
jgi:hypothetical protein